MRFGRSPAVLALALMLSFVPGPREARAVDSRVSAGAATRWTQDAVRSTRRRLTSLGLKALLLGQFVATAASLAIPLAPIFEGSAAVGHHAAGVEASGGTSRDGAATLAAALLPPVFGASAAFGWARRQRRELGFPDGADPQGVLARAAWRNKELVARAWGASVGPSEGRAAPGPADRPTEFSPAAAVAAVRDLYGALRDSGAKLAIAPKKALLVLDAARVVVAGQDRWDRLVAPTALTALSAGLLSVLPGEIYPWVTSLSLILPAPFAASFVRCLASKDVARARMVTQSLLERAINP